MRTTFQCIYYFEVIFYDYGQKFVGYIKTYLLIIIIPVLSVPIRKFKKDTKIFKKEGVHAFSPKSNADYNIVIIDTLLLLLLLNAIIIVRKRRHTFPFLLLFISD